MSLALRGVLVGTLATVALAAMPAAASAAFVPGRFEVAGKGLAGKRGTSLSVHLRPQAVSVRRCRVRSARVRRTRGGVRLGASGRCGKRRLKLTARVRGARMRGSARVGRRLVRFRARRARRIGVLLRGSRSRRALTATRDVDRLKRHPGHEVSSLDRRRVARTEIVLRFESTATVGQMNRLLRSAGGGIVGSRKGSPSLIVAIPDPGTARALARLVRRLSRTRVIKSVTTSAMAGSQQLPPGIASPATSAQTSALSHLLTSGVATAWNARSAIRLGEQPTTVVADKFGDGRLSRQINARQRTRIDQFPDPDHHGYQVASILFATFGSTGAGAGLATGVFPARGELVTIDVIGMTLPAVAQRIVETLDSVQSRVVLNTSLGENGGQPDRYTFPEAADWIRDVQREGLEQRVVHAASAGNDGLTGGSARTNGLFSAAGIRTDIIDPLSEGRVGPLSNTLVVENATEKSDLSELDCRSGTSNPDGNLAGPGTDIYSLDKDGRVIPPGRRRNGTSLASPVVAGLATYLWSIAPDLSPQQIKSAILANAKATLSAEECLATQGTAPRLDAYAALLSIDGASAPTPATHPVRNAILDLDGGGFTERDLATWAPRVDESRVTTTRDWSRYDLNGDGFTGGTRGAAFDLSRSTSTRAGSTVLDGGVPLMVRDQGRNLDERSPLLTDDDVLCYYAYSGLYTGNVAQRDLTLSRCRKCATVTNTFANGHSQAGEDFAPAKTLAYRRGSGRVKLAGNCDGTDPIHVDDQIIVEIKHADGSTGAPFTFDFSGDCAGAIGPSGPFDITSRLEPGNNTIKVRFVDKCGQGGSSSSRIVVVR